MYIIDKLILRTQEYFNTLNQVVLLLYRFFVAPVSHDDEAKLNRERRRSVTGGIQEKGKGGVAVVGKPRLTKAGRRRQTG